MIYSNSESQSCPSLPPGSGLIQHIFPEMLFEEFKDGCHGGYLGYWKGTILANLNLQVALRPIHAKTSVFHTSKLFIM